MPKQRSVEQFLKDFGKFCEFLIAAKYKLELSIFDVDNMQFLITGNNIFGYLFYNFNMEQDFTTNDFKYSSRIFIDHRKCFDKQWKCPFNLKIPHSNHFEWYVTRMQFWGTDKGYEISNSFKWSEFDRHE